MNTKAIRLQITLKNVRPASGLLCKYFPHSITTANFSHPSVLIHLRSAKSLQQYFLSGNMKEKSTHCTLPRLYFGSQKKEMFSSRICVLRENIFVFVTTSWFFVGQRYVSLRLTIAPFSWRSGREHKRGLSHTKRWHYDDCELGILC